jgi:hypothetical protein
VNNLKMKYNGPDNATLIASAKVGAFYIPILIVSDLDAGETFTLDGAKNLDRRGGLEGTLGTEVILVQAVKGRITTTSIHTSCSQPIYSSYEAGMYTTLSGSSKIGGLLCFVAPPKPEPVPEKEECGKNSCRHKCDNKCEDSKGRNKCEHKCDYKKVCSSKECYHKHDHKCEDSKGRLKCEHKCDYKGSGKDKDDDRKGWGW